MNTTMLAAGHDIPAVSTVVTRALIDAFGEIANDHNPVHFDDAFARSRGFAGAIAHGAITASFLFEMMSRWLPDWPREGDDMQVTFISPVLVDDEVIARGVVAQVADGAAVCEVWCEKAGGQKVVVGKARVALPREGDR